MILGERFGGHTVRTIVGTTMVLLASTRAAAQDAPAEAPVILPPVNVTATPILPGLPDIDKVPSSAQIFDREAVTRDGFPALLRTLGDSATGVSFDDAQGNPWQPNLIYRGFEASPLAGNPQGLAVYVNGSRFNQPFGDTTNWDLIPDIAIDRIDLVGSNPAFGLNALGGALAVRLRDGFTYHGAEAELLGGSFGRIQGSFQYGVKSDNTSAYVAGTGMHENGWRDFSPTTLGQIYADIGWRGDAAELHMNIMAADNDLVGNGTTPVDLLSVSRSAIFTHPDETKNKYVRVGLSGTYGVNDQTTIQVNAYYSNLSQRTFNGDAAGIEVCDTDPTIICQDNGPPLQNRIGGTIPDFITNSPYVTQFGFTGFANGGPYAFLNRTATDTNGYGVQTQVEHSFTFLGMPHHLVAGASYDGGSTEFTASTLIGGLSLDRGFAGPGVVIVTADGSVTPVRVHAFNNYYGLYITDTIDITPRLSGTLSARLNSAQISLNDQIGTGLNGVHSYNRLNPAVGLTYKILPTVSVYAGYAETNRAPTPAELSCADPASPCSLTNFFVGDPNLQQVVAHTFEVGLRGSHGSGSEAKLNWNVGLFRTTNDNDILFVSSDTVGRAFFRNVGQTRRQGVELGLRFHMERLNVYANYAFTDATFQTALTLNSDNNPFADANAAIHVQPGNRLPGIPRNLFQSGCRLQYHTRLGARFFRHRGHR
jgi:iron complex outermembrane recepter protein